MEWLMGKKGKKDDAAKQAAAAAQSLVTSAQPSSGLPSLSGGGSNPPRSVYDALYLQTFVVSHDEAPATSFDAAIHVALPHGIESREWIATHAISFFTSISQLHEAICPAFCSSKQCPTMLVRPSQPLTSLLLPSKSASTSTSSLSLLSSSKSRSWSTTNNGVMTDPVSESRITSTQNAITTNHAVFPDKLVWVDEKGKRSTATSDATSYIDLALSWIHLQMNDKYFPTKRGENFPLPVFDTVISRIFQHLYHVTSHILVSHYVDLVSIGLHPYFNTVFKHLVVFLRTFQLIQLKQLDDFDDVLAIMSARDPARRLAPSAPSHSPNNNTITTTQPALSPRPPSSTSMGRSTPDSLDNVTMAMKQTNLSSAATS